MVVVVVVEQGKYSTAAVTADKEPANDDQRWMTNYRRHRPEQRNIGKRLDSVVEMQKIHQKRC